MTHSVQIQTGKFVTRWFETDKSSTSCHGTAGTGNKCQGHISGAAKELEGKGKNLKAGSEWDGRLWLTWEKIVSR